MTVAEALEKKRLVHGIGDPEAIHRSGNWWISPGLVQGVRQDDLACFVTDRP